MRRARRWAFRAWCGRANGRGEGRRWGRAHAWIQFRACGGCGDFGECVVERMSDEWRRVARLFRVREAGVWLTALLCGDDSRRELAGGCRARAQKHDERARRQAKR